MAVKERRDLIGLLGRKRAAVVRTPASGDVAYWSVQERPREDQAASWRFLPGVSGISAQDVDDLVAGCGPMPEAALTGTDDDQRLETAKLSDWPTAKLAQMLGLVSRPAPDDAPIAMDSSHPLF